jgi:dCTP deaminase
MILSAQTIQYNCMNDRKMIEPFLLRTVSQGMTYGLSAAGYDVRIAQKVDLRPGAFVLASIMERLVLPSHIMAIVHDKSTWARRGLALQNTVAEPGWRGHLTLELSNHGPSTLQIEAGSPIAQLVFHQLDQKTLLPYQGKYQDQGDYPQAAKFEQMELPV